MVATNPYLLLAVMHATGVMAVLLDNMGYGRVEDKVPASDATRLLLSAVLLLSTGSLAIGALGVVVNTLWAAFALSFWRVIGLALLSQIVWGGICSLLIGYIRVSSLEDVLHSIGIPIVFALRLTSAGAAIGLFVGLWRGFAYT